MTTDNTNNNTPVTDEEVRAWVDGLGPQDQAEIRRQALLKRALELAEPDKPVDWASLTDEQLRAQTRKWGF